METRHTSVRRGAAAAEAVVAEPHVLLVGPYDPAFGEDACLAPPLAVWRIAGVLGAAGARVRVFDPNFPDDAGADTAAGAEAVGDALAKVLTSRVWHLIAFWTTAPTLRFDLGLAHLARRLSADSVIAAGGSEAASHVDALFRVGSFDLIVLGQGETPLLDLVERMRQGASARDVQGTAWIGASDEIHRLSQPGMDRQAFRAATFLMPYAQMPFRSYWETLTRAYKLHDLPVRAERETRLAEVQAIRLDTLGGRPMGACACSPANVPFDAQSVGRATRLEAEDCVAMVTRIASAWPDVKTIVFEDDPFVFTADQRLRPLCEGLIAARRTGDIPPELHFVSTNRIDTMDETRLALMKRAGFRILEFGVESFARDAPPAFDHMHIRDSVTPVLQFALKLGLTPFLELLLTSPRCGMKDVAFNVATAFKWLQSGCEACMRPYLVPHAGAATTRDPELLPFTMTVAHAIGGTSLVWEQPTKILPIDPEVRDAVLKIERAFAECSTMIEREVARMPARVRSLLWIACAVPVLASDGEIVPNAGAVVRALVSRLPVPPAKASKLVPRLTAMIGSAPGARGAR